MFLIFAKVQPFLKELRLKAGDPHMFGNIEEVIMSSKFGRDRLKLTLKRVAALREKVAAAKAS
jgi:hypothetical protein